MIKIDYTLLDELGLGGLPPAEKDSLLKHIYETLEMRVGMRLADQMSNEQLDEFERYFEAKDDAGAFKWLETNFPNYKQIVQEEFDKLKLEIKQSAPQILATSQATAPAATPTGAYPPSMPPNGQMPAATPPPANPWQQPPAPVASPQALPQDPYAPPTQQPPPNVFPGTPPPSPYNPPANPSGPFPPAA